MSSDGLIYQYKRCMYMTGNVLATYPCAAMPEEQDIARGSLWNYSNEVS